MLKRILATLVLVGVLAAMAGVAYAVDQTATVVITGGTLSVTPADVTLSGVTLDGTDKTSTSASSANSWSAQDSRGTGVGWNLTILATDFSGGGHTIDISTTDSKFQVQLLDANITVIAGNTKPTSPVTSLTDIPKVTALKFASAAAGNGMGSYSIKPNFQLGIPAETYAGTYTSTITVSAVSGP